MSDSEASISEKRFGTNDIKYSYKREVAETLMLATIRRLGEASSIALMLCDPYLARDFCEKYLVTRRTFCVLNEDWLFRASDPLPFMLHRVEREVTLQDKWAYSTREVMRERFSKRFFEYWSSRAWDLYLGKFSYEGVALFIDIAWAQLELNEIMGYNKTRCVGFDDIKFDWMCDDEITRSYLNQPISWCAEDKDMWQQFLRHIVIDDITCFPNFLTLMIKDVMQIQ